MIKPCVLRCLQQVAHRPPPLMHCTRCMSTNLSPSPDWSYLLNTENTDEIRLNIANRKGVGDIEKVVSLKLLLICNFITNEIQIPTIKKI